MIRPAALRGAPAIEALNHRIGDLWSAKNNFQTVRSQKLPSHKINLLRGACPDVKTEG
jgi:hypothetical protein